MIQPIGVSDHDSDDVFTLHDSRSGRAVHVRTPPSDIDGRISFSYIRCLYSLVGILLALSDIPRTGLSIDLFSYYPRVGPGTAMYYGPYAYPVVHVNRTVSNDNASSSLSGFSGDLTVDAIDVWAYKFDSLSIPTRALAEHLGVGAYPPCLLYRSRCADTTLALTTVFGMLDELTTAIHQRFFSHTLHAHVPLVFMTTNYWADRLHHVVLGKSGYRVDSRTHTVHRFTMNSKALLPLNVCSVQYSSVDWHRPLLCRSVVAWRCDHPTLGAAKQVSLADSIALRVSALQKQYPNMTLEVTMITTQSNLQSQKVRLPTVFFESDNTEVTTLIRGRTCSSSDRCRTVFLDDYRYERATIETSTEDLKAVTSLFRAVAQVYIWLRVLLLFWTCSQTRLKEPRIRTASARTKIWIIFKTLVRVPSHTILYSSWLPILAYSVAHFIDCGLVHLISDNFWSSSNGFFTFDLVAFVSVASIQMRNIWMIALAWKCALSVGNRFWRHRSGPWVPQHGLIAFRGMFIGVTSVLTIFSFLRALRFRDSRVRSFILVSRSVGQGSWSSSQSDVNIASDFGYPQDVKTTVVAGVLIAATVHLVRAMGRPRRHTVHTRAFLCRTLYVPASTGVLFSRSALSVLWFMNLKPIQASAEAASLPPTRHSSLLEQIFRWSSRALSAVLPLTRKQSRGRCDMCDFVSLPLHWHAVRGCRRHEALFTVGARSLEVQSMVRLTNIGLLSDPLVFFQLRVLGRELYVYRRHSVSLPEPTARAAGATGPATTLVDADTSPDDSCFLSPVLIHQKRCEFELVGMVSSATVPLNLLVDCG